MTNVIPFPVPQPRDWIVHTVLAAPEPGTPPCESFGGLTYTEALEVLADEEEANEATGYGRSFMARGTIEEHIPMLQRAAACAAVLRRLAEVDMTPAEQVYASTCLAHKMLDAYLGGFPVR